MTETLVATITRPVTFSDSRQNLRTFPIGTEVYVRERRDGKGFDIRVCGTLFRQHVYPSTLLVP